MYMNPAANLDYWSTDNCCSRWTLRTGTIVIGMFTMLTQALLATVGIMAAISCPLVQNNSSMDLFNSSTFEEDLSQVQVLEIECDDKGTSGTAEDSAVDAGTKNDPIIVCPLVPGPELESFGIHDVSNFLLMIGIFVTYCCIYFILSVCIVVGALWRSPRLIRGWVAFTSLHMVIVLADLLCTLAHTTLPHLCTSLALFVYVIYTWAVVRSYMLTLSFEMKQPLVRQDDDTTDYTVNGVDIEETPVQV